MKTLTPRLFLTLFLSLTVSSSLCYAQRGGGGGGRGGGGGGRGGGRGGAAEFEPGLRLLNSPNWVFPFDLAKAGTTGSAEMTYFVDPTGKPINIKVAKATKPDFGQAAIAVLEVARYSPALNEKTGKPEKSTEQKMTIPFDKNRIDTEALEMLAKPDGVLFAVTDLDTKALAPVGTVPRAIFPEKQASKKVAAGTAQIEVVVDKNGVVRVPRIVSASEPDFGWSAATAALGYQFPKPVKGGKPVAVKLVIPFAFSLAEANAAAASATSAAPALPAPTPAPAKK